MTVPVENSVHLSINISEVSWVVVAGVKLGTSLNEWPLENPLRP